MSENQNDGATYMSYPSFCIGDDSSAEPLSARHISCTAEEEEEEEEMCNIPYDELEWCHLIEYDTHVKKFR